MSAAGKGGKKGQKLVLQIDELAARGDGVGRDDTGRVTFVPGAAPGDRLEIEITDARKDFARGRIARILEPGPSRIDPPCGYFERGLCGGCHWQHVDVATQRQAKQALVARALRAAIEGGLHLEPIATPVAELGWRRRARLHWFRSPAAVRAEIGFHAPRSHFVTDVVVCLQLSESLAAGYQRVRNVLARSLHGRGQIHMVASESGVHVVIDGACNPAAAQKLAECRGIAGVRVGATSFGETGIEIDGAVTAADEFAQASDQGNRALLDVVRERVAPWIDGARVLELFAGSGNLGRALVGAEVVAVDRSERPHARVEQGGPAQLDWRQGDAAEVVAELAAAGERFDAVVMDPPRQGAREVCEAIPALGIQRILYVSCDPATLARDLKILAVAGLKARWARPLDLMPQTSHVEVVVELSRDQSAEK